MMHDYAFFKCCFGMLHRFFGGGEEEGVVIFENPNFTWKSRRNLAYEGLLRTHHYNIKTSYFFKKGKKTNLKPFKPLHDTAPSCTFIVQTCCRFVNEIQNIS